MTEGAFDFVQVKLDRLLQGNLVETLKDLLPGSVQALNLFKVITQQDYNPERIKAFEIFSYEQQSQVNIPANKDWSDPSRPLFLVFKIHTKYTMEGSDDYTFCLFFSRETLSPSDPSLSSFISLFSTNINSASKDAPFVLGTVDQRHIPFLEKMAEERGKQIKVYPNNTLYLPENIMDSDVPSRSDFTLKPLTPSNADLVNSAWKYGTEGTLPLVRDQILHSPSIGAFTPSTNDPACWAITMPTGTINALQTLSPFRRLGLASSVLRTLCLVLREKGLIPLCEVELESTASKNMMDKLGFQLAFEGVWVDIF